MNAKIQLQRDSGYADFGRKYSVLIDGKSVGLIKNEGLFECDIPSGRHTLQLTVDWCSSNTLEFEAVDGTCVRFNCGSNLRGWKIFSSGKVMRETPNAWIWLKSSKPSLSIQ